MHTLLDLRSKLPSFMHVSDSKLHDANARDLLIPEADIRLRARRRHQEAAPPHLSHSLYDTLQISTLKLFEKTRWIWRVRGCQWHQNRLAPATSWFCFETIITGLG